MRTLKKYVQEALGMKEEERRYQICGEFVFVFFAPSSDQKCPRECSKELEVALQEAILEVDELYPWRDTIEYYEHNKLVAPSIDHLSQAENQFNNWGGASTELCVWFEIEPGVKHVRKGQIYAYEKYLAKLAKELAKKRHNLGFTSVRSIFNTRSETTFK